MQDALEYSAESFDAWPSAAPCLVEKRTTLPLARVLSYGDYSAWGEWKHGELPREGDPTELFQALASFRGPGWAREALRWLQDGIPAIVIVDSKYGTDIADGRGRTSLAVGLGLEELPVILLTDCSQPRRKRVPSR